MNREFKGSKPFWALQWAVIFLVVYWRLPDLLAAMAQMRVAQREPHATTSRVRIYASSSPKCRASIFKS